MSRPVRLIDSAGKKLICSRTWLRKGIIDYISLRLEVASCGEILTALLAGWLSLLLRQQSLRSEVNFDVNRRTEDRRISCKVKGRSMQRCKKWANVCWKQMQLQKRWAFEHGSWGVFLSLHDSRLKSKMFTSFWGLYCAWKGDWSIIFPLAF